MASNWFKRKLLCCQYFRQAANFSHFCTKFHQKILH